MGIGQNVTGTGLAQLPTGVLATVFDVSDPAQPLVVAREMLAEEENTEVLSNALWDFKAVQYHNGVLAIPLSTYEMLQQSDDFGDWFDSTLGFEGFVVLDVGDAANQGIKELFRVNHQLENSCFTCSSLGYSRSYFFDEDNTIMTISGSLVISSDVTTGEEIWALNVTTPV